MNHSNLSDLLQRCRDGDPAAVENLVQTHREKVYRLALSVLDDPAEADEAAQDAFVAALGKLGSFRGNAAFSTWLYAITLNACRARLRRRRVQARLREALQAVFRRSPAPPGPEEAVVQNEADAAIWSAIEALDEKHRLPIILRYYHEFSIPEIAAILGIREGTVHSRLYTARERLRRALAPNTEPESFRLGETRTAPRAD